MFRVQYISHYSGQYGDAIIETKEVEADSFGYDKELLVFHKREKTSVFSIRTLSVVSVERIR